jgi:hypothetical protein
MMIEVMKKSQSMGIHRKMTRIPTRKMRHQGTTLVILKAPSLTDIVNNSYANDENYNSEKASDDGKSRDEDKTADGRINFMALPKGSLLKSLMPTEAAIPEPDWCESSSEGESELCQMIKEAISGSDNVDMTKYFLAPRVPRYGFEKKLGRPPKNKILPTTKISPLSKNKGSRQGVKRSLAEFDAFYDYNAQVGQGHIAITSDHKKPRLDCLDEEPGVLHSGLNRRVCETSSRRRSVSLPDADSTPNFLSPLPAIVLPVSQPPTQSKEDSVPSALENLPRAVMERILRYLLLGKLEFFRDASITVFEDEDPLEIGGMAVPIDLHPQILQASRKFHDIGVDVLYQENTFRLTGFLPNYLLDKLVSISNWRKMTSIILLIPDEETTTNLQRGDVLEEYRHLLDSSHRAFHSLVDIKIGLGRWNPPPDLRMSLLLALDIFCNQASTSKREVSVQVRKLLDGEIYGYNLYKRGVRKESPVKNFLDKKEELYLFLLDSIRDQDKEKQRLLSGGANNKASSFSSNELRLPSEDGLASSQNTTTPEKNTRAVTPTRVFKASPKRTPRQKQSDWQTKLGRTMREVGAKLDFPSGRSLESSNGDFQSPSHGTYSAPTKKAIGEALANHINLDSAHLGKQTVSPESVIEKLFGKPFPSPKLLCDGLRKSGLVVDLAVVTKIFLEAQGRETVKEHPIHGT